MMIAFLTKLMRHVTRPLAHLEAKRAASDWRQQESRLRQAFLGRAAEQGVPRGLAWKNCEWTGETCFARERASRLLTAFTGIVVHFEPIAGEGLEDAPAARMPRDATAVFHYRSGTWGTGGRALFNMTPHEAGERLAGQFEPIDVTAK